MQSFDGMLLWTYGLRTERVGGTDVTKVDVIAFDPVALRVVKRQEVGRGPAHSVVLTPDRKQVLMNVAGDDLIVYIDPATTQVTHAVPVGKFPCDLHLSPDGRTAYLPDPPTDRQESELPRGASPTCSGSRPTASTSGSRRPSVT